MSDLSFQLYSARNHPSLPDFLAKLSALGYKQVEGFGGLYADAAGLAGELKKNGLAMPTAHFGLEQLQDVSSALKISETLGVKRIYCPFVPPEQRGTGDDGWTRLAETLGELGDRYIAEGYGFGWHNHDFEFVPTPSGRLPMDIILETAPKIEWECDIAWLLRGQADPSAWFERYGQRITAVHVKDIAPQGENGNEDGWADVGHGVVGWDDLIGKVTAQTGALYLVLEHDKPADALRFATRSHATASKWDIN